MARRLRFIPEGGSLVAVSQRCFQARFLLTPSGRVNELISGIVAKAQQLYGVEVIGLSVPSNHLHFLLWVQDAQQLARFMNYVASNIAREVGRIQGWSGSFWGERYTQVLVDEDEAAQVEQLRYLLEQGCKENLVSRPCDWPGLHAARAILSGCGLEGRWVDRTAYHRRGRPHRGSQTAGLQAFTEKTRIRLSQLPCWADLTEAEYQGRVRDLVRGIEEETARRHRAQGTRALGRRAVRRQNPRHRPVAPKRSRTPLVHAATRAARRRIEEAYRLFVLAYRAAAERLKGGDREARFPAGSFPPALPFVIPLGRAAPG